MTRGLLTPIAAAVCLALASACSEPGAPAVPGDVVVTLTAPPPGPAAVLLALDGPGVLGIEVPDSRHVMFWHQRSSKEAVAIVIGEIDSGPLITARIPDVANAGGYTVRLLQVAASELRLTSEEGWRVLGGSSSA